MLTALTAGRLREAIAPKPVPPSQSDPDYLSGRSGTLGRRTMLAGRLRDVRANLAATRQRRALRRTARGTPRRRVLVVSIVRPENARRAASHARAGARALPPRGRADGASWRRPRRAGKWANLNAALPHGPPRGFDWLLIVDDDIVLPRGFLDVFLALAERYHFRLAQPAHAFASHAAWEITRRRPGVLAHRTRFVEIGPVTAIRADAFHALLPFPDLQMGWGLDAHWGALAASAAGRSASSTRRRSATARPGRRLLPARRGDGRGRPLPRRQAVRDARAGGRGARGVSPRTPPANGKLVLVASSPRGCPVAAGTLLEDGAAFTPGGGLVWCRRGRQALLGELEAPTGSPTFALGAGALLGAGAVALPVTLEHAQAVGTLAWHHRDPFDRMLVAQADIEHAVVVSADEALRAYDVQVAW